MHHEAKAPLAPLTTLRLGGPARDLYTARTETELVDAVRTADESGTPLLLFAGGSNLVVADAGFDGTAVLIRTRGVQVRRHDGRVEVTVAAGHGFDDLVAQAVSEGWAGIECLSGVPGSAGATPIQNVGAYGQEVAETITAVRAFDRRAAEVVTLSPEQCAFRFRHSRFKDDDRYVVLAVTFTLRADHRGAPPRYGELSRRLGLSEGDSAPLAKIRETVLELRAGKGMVLDADDHDTWSVGSFFVNPILDESTWDEFAARVDVEAPHWTLPEGRVKLPAAWLIEQAGFAKGHGFDGVSISTKHTLALTHRGDGSTTALLKLAREIRDGVFDRFGIRLTNEPVLVGERL